MVIPACFPCHLTAFLYPCFDPPPRASLHPLLPSSHTPRPYCPQSFLRIDCVACSPALTYYAGPIPRLSRQSIALSHNNESFCTQCNYPTPIRCMGFLAVCLQELGLSLPHMFKDRVLRHSIHVQVALLAILRCLASINLVSGARQAAAPSCWAQRS